MAFEVRSPGRRYEYDVFGALRQTTGTSANPFRFTGEQQDVNANRGLYYLRARHYDPALGRFLGRDPLPLAQRYAYVSNNPANVVDPSGLFDPRDLVDPLIGLIPEGRIPFVHKIPYIGPTLSFQLTATCVLYPEACAAGAAATAEASVMTLALFGTHEPPEGSMEQSKEGDAFQHCYWSGLITLAVGAGKAKRITTRFEAYGSSDINDASERAYDMINNQRGRDFASGLRGVRGARAALLARCL